MKKRTKKKQIQIQIERPLPTELDDEIEFIQFCPQDRSSSEDISLNKGLDTVEQPVQWWINDAGSSIREYKDGRLEGNFNATTKYRELSLVSFRDTSRLHRTILGEKISPTQVISLLSQNLNDTPRPINATPWSTQPDEGYYISELKKGDPEWIATTRENYYCINENSEHRLKFRCPELVKGDRESVNQEFLNGDKDEYCILGEDSWLDRPIVDIGDILVYINPANDQAVWHCPRCSKKYNKKVTHPLPKNLRTALMKDGTIPSKKYKNKNRLEEAPELLKFIIKHGGMSFYELDQAMGWDTDGRTSERIINKQLKDRVELRKSRKGHKGYRVYIRH